MSDPSTAPAVPDGSASEDRPNVLLGPARDFAAFCELERERRLSSDDAFDPDLMDEAVALVLARLGGEPR